MIFNLFLFLCFYLPFQIALNPTSQVDLSSLRILIPLLFLGWIFEKIKNKRKIFVFDIQEKLVLFFLFLSFGSLFFAKDCGWATRKLAYLFSIFPIYFIARDILDNKEKIIKTLVSLVFSSALVSFLGIIQFFSQILWSHDEISNFYLNFAGPVFWGENLAKMVGNYSSFLVGVSGHNYFRAIATFPDPHSFSLFLGMALPLSAVLFFVLRKKFFAVILFMLIFIANILTFSRGGYVAISLGIIFFIIIFWKKMEWKHRITSGFLALFFILMFSVPGPVSQRFVSSFDSKEGSNLGRIAMWQKSLEIIKSKPFFGTGIGNFSLEVDRNINYRNPIYAHNTYLDIAVEQGVPACLIWIVILMITLWNFWMLSHKNMIYAGFFTSIIIFSAHSLVETGLYSPLVLSLFLIILSFFPKYEK